jgi:hypothetical protein
MATLYTNLLTEEELAYLSALPEVTAAKATIDIRTSGSVYFTVAVPDTIRQKLSTMFGVDLTTSVPMRWIKGDTTPHVDVGATAFDTTYLMYLSDSPGTLVVDGATYPIARGTAYSFQEGLNHETTNTGIGARLLLGPMSERGMTVGGVLPPPAPTTTCCVESEEAIGLPYDTRNDITIGNIVTQVPPTRFASYEDFYKMKKAKSTRR